MELGALIARGVPWEALRDLTPGDALVLADGIVKERRSGS